MGILACREISRTISRHAKSPHVAYCGGLFGKCRENCVVRSHDMQKFPISLIRNILERRGIPAFFPFIPHYFLGNYKFSQCFHYCSHYFFWLQVGTSPNLKTSRQKMRAEKKVINERVNLFWLSILVLIDSLFSFCILGKSFFFLVLASPSPKHKSKQWNNQKVQLCFDFPQVIFLFGFFW